MENKYNDKYYYQDDSEEDEVPVGFKYNPMVKGISKFLASLIK